MDDSLLLTRGQTETLVGYSLWGNERRFPKPVFRGTGQGRPFYWRAGEVRQWAANNGRLNIFETKLAELEELWNRVPLQAPAEG